MIRVVDWYFRGLRMFIAACLALMVVLVFGNVVLRYAFNSRRAMPCRTCA